MVLVRPLIDAVPLLRLRRDLVEEEETLLLGLLDHFAVGQPKAHRDLVELRLTMHPRRRASGEGESSNSNADQREDARGHQVAGRFTIFGNEARFSFCLAQLTACGGSVVSKDTLSSPTG